jgi:hypothetical protein
LFRCSVLPVSFIFFPVFQSTLPVLCSFCLPTLRLVILLWSRAGLRLLLPPIVLFRFLSIIIYGTDFYVFFLWSGLLISFLFQLVPVLYSTFGFWCLPSLHAVRLQWSSAGLRLFPPPIVLFCICLFINHILQYLSCSFLPLCSCRCPSTLFPI